MNKEEILKKHIDKYRTIKVVNESVVATVEQSILESMEEYAKQEAKAFAKWGYENNLSFSQGLNIDIELNRLWHEYQQSKTK